MSETETKKNDVIKTALFQLAVHGTRHDLDLLIITPIRTKTFSMTKMKILGLLLRAVGQMELLAVLLPLLLQLTLRMDKHCPVMLKHPPQVYLIYQTTIYIF